MAWSPPESVYPRVECAGSEKLGLAPKGHCRTSLAARDTIAEGGIAPICLVFIGYRASIAEIPLLRGGIAPPLRMRSKGGKAQKRGRAYRTQLAMLRHQQPHSAQ